MDKLRPLFPPGTRISLEMLIKMAMENHHGVLNALDQVAERLDATPAAVSLAWLIAQPAVTAPIASATSQRQFDQLVQATQLKLDDDALKILDEASRPDQGN